MRSASPNKSSRRAVIRSAAWTAPVVAVAAAAPAFAASRKKLGIASFTSRDISGNGTPGTYQLVISIQNTTTASVPAGWSITFTFAAGYAGVKNNQTTPSNFTVAVTTNTVTYTSTLPIAPGTTSFTFTVDTNAKSTGTISAVVSSGTETSDAFEATRL